MSDMHDEVAAPDWDDLQSEWEEHNNRDDEEPMAFNGRQQGGAKQPYHHKTNRGSMFDNDRKTKDTQPDFTGSIDVNGTVYWISGWKEMSQSGKRKLSIAINPQEERPKDKDNQPQPQGGRRQVSGW